MQRDLSLLAGEEKGSVLLDVSAQVDLCMEGSCSAAGHTFKSILNYNNAPCVFGFFFLSLLNKQIRLKNKPAGQTALQLNTKLSDCEYPESHPSWNVFLGGF